MTHFVRCGLASLVRARAASASLLANRSSPDAPQDATRVAGHHEPKSIVACSFSRSEAVLSAELLRRWNGRTRATRGVCALGWQRREPIGARRASADSCEPRSGESCAGVPSESTSAASPMIIPARRPRRRRIDQHKRGTERRTSYVCDDVIAVGRPFQGEQLQGFGGERQAATSHDKNRQRVSRQSAERREGNIEKDIQDVIRANPTLRPDPRRTDVLPLRRRRRARPRHGEQRPYTDPRHDRPSHSVTRLRLVLHWTR